MKSIAKFSALAGLPALIASTVAAQAATQTAPQSIAGKMRTLPVADDHQPLYPAVCDIIYAGVLIVALFLSHVLYRTFRDRTYPH